MNLTKNPIINLLNPLNMLNSQKNYPFSILRSMELLPPHLHSLKKKYTTYTHLSSKLSKLLLINRLREEALSVQILAILKTIIFTPTVPCAKEIFSMEL